MLDKRFLKISLIFVKVLFIKKFEIQKVVEKCFKNIVHAKFLCVVLKIIFGVFLYFRVCEIINKRVKKQRS